MSVVGNAPASQIFLALNDDITLEYDDTVELVYEPKIQSLVAQFFDQNEFIRQTVVVHIIDNDGTFCIVDVISLHT